MLEEFFDTIRYNYSINQKLEKWMASRVKLAFCLAKVQKDILEKLGYKNLAPLSIDYDKIWFYIKDDKFHTVDDGNKKRTYRRWAHLYGDILLCLNDEGYHFCEPSTEERQKTYKVEDGEYYFLWDNDEYTVLKYMKPMRTQYCKDEFEYIKSENYVAINYHKKIGSGDYFMSEEERRIIKPQKDTIISKTKEIYHTEVFTYYYNDKIVVYDDEELIVYDKEFNILYDKYSDFEIWEVNPNSFLLFPSDNLVYDLSKCEEIKLFNNSDFCWDYVKIYKNIAVFYTIEHFQVEENLYNNDEGFCLISDYNVEDIPIRKTTGHIFDSSFNLLRQFNIKGEIVQLKEMSNAIVMMVNSTSIEENDTIAFYNINEPNITQHDNKSGEDFSVPDISIREMVGFCQNLAVVKTRRPLLDFIDLTNPRAFSEKCGVYSCVDSSQGIYEKIIECKYDDIKSFPVEGDQNIYYAGVIAFGDCNKFDLYVNHKIVMQGIPFIRGHSVKLIEDGAFIQITNSDGRKGIIRNGKFILDPIYKEIKPFVQYEMDYDLKTDDMSETLKYLFAVSKDELFGICSPSGKLLLPMKYLKVDMDEKLCIVLVRDFDTEDDEGSDEDNCGRICEIGHYNEEKDIIEIKKARLNNGNILLDEEGDYVWDGCFKYLKEGEIL